MGRWHHGRRCLISRQNPKIAKVVTAMFDWKTLLRKPDNFQDGPIADNWFSRIASRLLEGSRLIVGGEPHRLVEVEVYYSGAEHLDPFAHRDPSQLVNGGWYFHRSHGAYRGGSYKGLDLAFSDGEAFGGVLIRSVEKADGSLVVGPSLCVDRFLGLAKTKSVAELVGKIDDRRAWDTGNPLFLNALDEFESRPIFRSARVGLSLKRADRLPEFQRFLFRPYRYLTEPSRIKKGKAHLVLALYAEGIEVERIREITNSPLAAIRRYIDEFEACRNELNRLRYDGIGRLPSPRPSRAI